MSKQIMTTIDDPIKSYINGNYTVSIYKDGTKLRTAENVDRLIPEYPESIDLKITNFCNLNNLCGYCHEQSDPKGKHASVDRIIKFCKDLPGGVEIAIGGGNPLSHPDLNTITKELNDYGLIPNLTINQIHAAKLKNIPDNIYGLGISFRNRTYIDIDHDHVVWHLILGVHDYSDFMWLCRNYFSPKILWLGYKTIGNGSKYLSQYNQEVEDKIISVKNNIRKLNNHTELIAFDNLALTNLKLNSQEKLSKTFSNEKLDYDFMGEDGEYSMYFDAVENKYAIGSSYRERIDAGEMTAKECFGKINDI